MLAVVAALGSQEPMVQILQQAVGLELHS